MEKPSTTLTSSQAAAGSWLRLTGNAQQSEDRTVGKVPASLRGPENDLFRHCPLQDTLRKTAWPENPSLKEKLQGDLAALRMRENRDLADQRKRENKDMTALRRTENGDLAALMITENGDLAALMMTENGDLATENWDLAALRMTTEFVRGAGVSIYDDRGGGGGRRRKVLFPIYV